MVLEPAVYTADSVGKAADAWRAEGLTIVFTNGCFDLIHTGHTRYLRGARNLGDVLIVGVNTDESVRNLKGEDRPVMGLGERLEVLLSLRWVDAVVPFSESTPVRLIERIRPDILVKGGDWIPEKIAGRDIVEAYGGQVRTVPFHEGSSTSDIIRRIRSTQL
jgi:D-beta-D-heptose 7-phosphate kinase/D-beta-D-heptose 1-phosphate adenosyltransferase